MSAPREIPFVVRESAGPERTPEVTLGDQRIENLLANDGLSITYVADEAGISLPVVTLTFGPGALVLDFEVALLVRLLDAAEKAGR